MPEQSFRNRPEPHKKEIQDHDRSPAAASLGASCGAINSRHLKKNCLLSRTTAHTPFADESHKTSAT